MGRETKIHTGQGRGDLRVSVPMATSAAHPSCWYEFGRRLQQDCLICGCQISRSSQSVPMRLDAAVLRFSGTSSLHLLAATLDLFCARLLAVPHNVTTEDWR